MRAILLFPVYLFAVIKTAITSIIKIDPKDELCAKYCPFYTIGCCEEK